MFLPLDFLKNLCYNIIRNEKGVLKIMAEISLGSLYEFNKAAMTQVKPLDPIEFNIKTKEVIEEVAEEASEGKRYWMLLSNERKDYTVFKVMSAEGTLNEFRPTLKNRGLILSIDKQPDGNYEIWIRDPDTQENFIYYLFDYSFGVIEA